MSIDSRSFKMTLKKKNKTLKGKSIDCYLTSLETTHTFIQVFKQFDKINVKKIKISVYLASLTPFIIRCGFEFFCYCLQEK